MTMTGDGASEAAGAKSMPAGGGTTRPLTAEERQDAIDRLEQSAAELRTAVRELTNVQWTFKPSADRWSIAECADHVAIVEERVLGLVQRLAQTVPGQVPAALSDADVLTKVKDRSNRFQVPEVARPTARSADPQASMAAFGEARQRTVDFIRSTDASLRARTAPHPACGHFDGYQWLLAASAHVHRHIAQIEEIESAPGFPR
jgi:hypothetical protein